MGIAPNSMEPIVRPQDVLDAMSGKKTAFSEYDSANKDIYIRNITLREELIVEGLKCPSNISLVNCNFLERVIVRGGEFQGFSISGGQITCPLIVEGGVFNRCFSLREIDALAMDNETFDSLILSGGRFDGGLNIYKGAWQSIQIGDAVFKNIVIDTGAGSNFNHRLEPYIKRLSVAPREIGVLSVSDRKIEHLTLYGVLRGGLYAFTDVEFNQLEFRYFINRGQVLFERASFAELAPRSAKENARPSTLAMAHSDLGKTQFYDLDLSKLGRVEIQHCALTHVESSNTSWFLPAQLETMGDDAKRDLFRQLKHAMIQQGNRIDQLRFQAAEMEAYRKSLTFLRNPADFIILSFGKYTNNFGTNYVLPALWIIAVALLVFACSARIEGVPFRRAWGGVFEVLNPTHPIDYLAPKEKLSGAFMAVDFAGRVLISLLIYQLIAPFRKFARD